jgi:adenylate kinase
MAPSAINDPFSPVGPAAKTKVLLLDSSDVPPEWMNWARSLHIEHVSPVNLMSREISRTPPSPAGCGLRRTEAAMTALMRKWYFGRKPDAGFLLTEFPATLLQAKIFDEWLDARGEALDAVHAGPRSAADLVDHYRTLGLLAPSADMSAEASAKAESPP